MQGKILVIRGGAIGDFVLTLPAIAALRRQFPDAHLEVLGYPHIVQLAVAGGLVDRVSPIEARGLASFFARNGLLSEAMADYFSEFDLIISYLYDPDLVFQTNVARCATAQFIPGPHRPDEESGTPASLAFLKPLERLAIFDSDPLPRLPVKPHAARPNQLALHPGSGSARKNWPEEHWSVLLQTILDSTDYNVLLLGGEAEGERLQRLSAALPPARTRVAQSWPLAQVAGVLRGSMGYVGHDSGISHIAAAVGLPGVILWGESVQQVWRPPSERMAVLSWREGLAHLPPAHVFENLLATLTQDHDCGP